MVIRLLQEIDFMRGDRDKVLQEAFDGDSATLEFTTEDDGAMRAITCKQAEVSAWVGPR